MVYSDFLTLVRGGAVRSARIDEDNSRVYFELRRTAPDAAAGAHSHTRHPVLLLWLPAWTGVQARAAAQAEQARALAPCAGAVAAEAGTSGAVAAEAETGCAAAAPLFYAKRIADPGLIPALVTGGVEFGAIQARPASDAVSLGHCLPSASLRHLHLHAIMPSAGLTGLRAGRRAWRARCSARC